MSLLSENVIPGNHGKIFGTNAIEDIDLERIKSAILTLPGIKDVIIDHEIYPREFIVHTSSIVSVKEIEDKVIPYGFHVIPKSLFPL